MKSDDLKISLRVPCTECRDGIEAPFPIEYDALARRLAEAGWYLSVVTPPGRGKITFGALCKACAPRIYAPAVLAAAEEARKRLLAS